jgi:hypothetical protein
MIVLGGLQRVGPSLPPERVAASVVGGYPGRSRGRKQSVQVEPVRGRGLGQKSATINPSDDTRPPPRCGGVARRPGTGSDVAGPGPRGRRARRTVRAAAVQPDGAGAPGRLRQRNGVGCRLGALRRQSDLDGSTSDSWWCRHWCCGRSQLSPAAGGGTAVRPRGRTHRRRGSVVVLGTVWLEQAGLAGGTPTYERDPMFRDESLRFTALGCAALAGGWITCSGRFTWRRVAAGVGFSVAGGVVGWLLSSG